MNLTFISKLLAGIFGRRINIDNFSEENEVAHPTHIKRLTTFDIPHKPNKEVLKFIECPSRPRGISVFNELAILSIYRDKLQQIQMRLSLPDNLNDPDSFTFTNLVIRPMVELIRWTHLLPASENHHHNGIGGLFSHSLDVGLMALINAYETELSPIGYQDEEVDRKKRYLYAAFICGLVHDVGKVFDVDVINISDQNRTTWNPLLQSLMDWAKYESVENYEVLWRSREANQHVVRSGIFLERILNSTCLNYLSSVSREQIYDRMLFTLINYNRANDFLSNCVRKADYFSTGTDLNLIRNPILGIRSTDAATRALSAIRENFRELGINNYNNNKAMHIILISGEVYLNETAFIDFALKEFQKIDFNFPSGNIGSTALVDALIRRGYVEPYSESRVVHFFMPGNFHEGDIKDLFKQGIANTQWYNLLKLKWVGLLFDSYIIPDSVPGIFSVNENRDFLLVDDSGNRTEFLRSIPKREAVIKVSETVDKQIAGSNKDPEDTQSPITVQTTSNIAPENDDPTLISGNRELLKKLEKLLTSGKLPDGGLYVADGIPYVSVSCLKSLLPDLEENMPASTELFDTTDRDGSLETEWVVPDESGNRLSALGTKSAGYQLTATVNIQETTIQSLLDSPLYNTIPVESSDGDYAKDTVIRESLPLPYEHYSTEMPSLKISIPEGILNNTPPVDDEYYQHAQNNFDTEQYHADFMTLFGPINTSPVTSPDRASRTEGRNKDSSGPHPALPIKSKTNKPVKSESYTIELLTEVNTATPEHYSTIANAINTINELIGAQNKGAKFPDNYLFIVDDRLFIAKSLFQKLQFPNSFNKNEFNQTLQQLSIYTLSKGNYKAKCYAINIHDLLQAGEANNINLSPILAQLR
ncbi:MobH family relaxase [Photorhabdus heterorhabditis]|uniref:Uncharacterized domain-containing protein n=1 Tax=Photorhabdus heterorhabditis TaxID=880156 RepID=A0A5B0WHR1_9GAMM|nr:MobH family relaxase [Photorhabdus heterorhabditis]KAA1186432.1 hypothetical protein F0L16_13955 [Photorhabdus heterorhabditis]MBS9441201.1 hypothetical protein [Photorhabdus heterorhabditis]